MSGNHWGSPRNCANCITFHAGFLGEAPCGSLNLTTHRKGKKKGTYQGASRAAGIRLRKRPSAMTHDPKTPKATQDQERSRDTWPPRPCLTAKAPNIGPRHIGIHACQSGILVDIMAMRLDHTLARFNDTDDDLRNTSPGTGNPGNWINPQRVHRSRINGTKVAA